MQDAKHCLVLVPKARQGRGVKFGRRDAFALLLTPILHRLGILGPLRFAPKNNPVIIGRHVPQSKPKP